MKKNRLHIASLLLGGVMLLPLLVIIILQLWQVYLVNSVMERMEGEALQTVVVDERQVVWREKGREVTIDGEYFDLVSYNLKDGKYTFTGVYDREETAVVNLLEKQTQSGNSIVGLLLIGQCFGALVLYLIDFALRLQRRKNHPYFQNRYKFLFNGIIAPPPRL